MSSLRRALLATLPLWAGISQTQAAPVEIVTPSQWDGSTSIGDSGASGSSAWGPFVTAPVETNRLGDFTYLAFSATFDERSARAPEPWSLLLIASAGLAANAARRPRHAASL